MVHLVNAPTSILQWNSGLINGTTSGGGSNTHTLIHNQGKLCSYVKVVQNEGTSSEYIIPNYDREANLGSTNATNQQWGHRWFNTNINTVTITLYRQNIRGGDASVSAILYFFD